MNSEKNETQSGVSDQPDHKIVSLMDNLLPHLRLLYSRKKFLLICQVSIAVVAFIILWFIVPSTFEVSVSILPENTVTPNLSAISSIASSVGINLNTGGSTTIYSNLLLSEAVLEPVIMDKYRKPGEKDSANLIEIFDIDPVEDYPPTAQKRLQFITCYELLSEKGGIVPEMDASTGVLTVVVTMPSAKLAMDVANNLLKSLDNYLKYKRQSSAKNTRLYLDDRVTEIYDSLIHAEETLRRFNEQNRTISQSPQLLLEQNRLQRNVQVYNTLYTSLRSSLESAKLEEVKAVPVVNVREWAQDPVTNSGPRRIIFFIIIIVFSFVIISSFLIFKQRFANYFNLIIKK